MSNIPQPAARSAVSWNLSGNSGTNAATQFLGTIDEQPLVIKANNAEALRVTFTGNIGIGTDAPTSKLTVQAEGYGLVHTDGTRSVGSWVGSGAKADGGWLGTRSNHPLYFFTNNGDASMTLDVDGNLGIGGPSGGAKLEVEGTTVLSGTDGSALYVYSDSDWAAINARSAGGAALVARSIIGDIIIEGFSGDDRRFHIDNNGAYIAGSDFAEALPVRGDQSGYEPGDVLVLSEAEPGSLELAAQPYDHRLIGVYSTRPAVIGADKGGESRVDDKELPVAILGIVPTKVSADNGPIQPGDLLTTSSAPGRAMKAMLPAPQGTLLGKALEPLAEGTGVIRVLVTLR